MPFEAHHIYSAAIIIKASSGQSQLCASFHTQASSNSGNDNPDYNDSNTGTTTVLDPQTNTRKPSMYRVLLLNDDFTPMDFVIQVLQQFFNKSVTEATQIMLEVHTKGAGLAGVYSHEIAETKVFQVNQYAQRNRHPLKSTMEQA